MEHKLCDLVMDKRRYKSESHRTAWTKEEDQLLLQAIQALPTFSGEKDNGEEMTPIDWIQVSKSVPGRTTASCHQRYTKALRPGLKKGSWTTDEDDMLISMTLNGAMERGEMDWVELCKHIEGRTPKQCRERWKNVLDPSVQRGRWDPSEDNELFRLYSTFGPSWSVISREMHGRRNENMVKNRWRRLGPTPQGQACQQHFKAQKQLVEHEDAIERGLAAAATVATTTPTISPLLSRSPPLPMTMTATITAPTLLSSSWDCHPPNLGQDSSRKVKRQHSLDEPPPTQAASRITFGEFVELVALQESLDTQSQPQQDVNLIAPPATLRRVDSFYEDNCSLFNHNQQHDSE
ncbi:hypothetical protein BASA81_004233 [Batrachochytrium salamandrivorans]|nr:hypothetical protein BASA81_004233 [Batrachochytrium salamandrivorans]